MTKVYGDANDKYVSAIIVFVGEGNALFYDEAKTIPVPAEDCLNLFIKGVVAVKEGTYYKPVSCTTEGVIDFGIAGV